MYVVCSKPYSSKLTRDLFRNQHRFRSLCDDPVIFVDPFSCTVTNMTLYIVLLSVTVLLQGCQYLSRMKELAIYQSSVLAPLCDWNYRWSGEACLPCGDNEYGYGTNCFVCPKTAQAVPLGCRPCKTSETTSQGVCLNVTPTLPSPVNKNVQLSTQTGPKEPVRVCSDNQDPVRYGCTCPTDSAAAFLETGRCRICPKTTFAKNSACICPQGATWNSTRLLCQCDDPQLGLVLRGQKLSCSTCPNDQIMDETGRCVHCPRGAQRWSGTRCECPEGREASDGVCKACAELKKVPKGSGCSTCGLGGVFIPYTKTCQCSVGWGYTMEDGVIVDHVCKKCSDSVRLVWDKGVCHERCLEPYVWLGDRCGCPKGMSRTKCVDCSARRFELDMISLGDQLICPCSSGYGRLSPGKPCVRCRSSECCDRRSVVNDVGLCTQCPSEQIRMDGKCGPCTLNQPHRYDDKCFDCPLGEFVKEGKCVAGDNPDYCDTKMEQHNGTHCVPKEPGCPRLNSALGWLRGKKVCGGYYHAYLPYTSFAFGAVFDNSCGHFVLFGISWGPTGTVTLFKQDEYTYRLKRMTAKPLLENLEVAEGIDFRANEDNRSVTMGIHGFAVRLEETNCTELFKPFVAKSESFAKDARALGFIKS